MSNKQMQSIMIVCDTINTTSYIKYNNNHIP